MQKQVQLYSLSQRQVCMRGTACRSRCSSTASPRDRYVCGVQHAEAGAALQPLPETGMYAGYSMRKQVQLYSLSQRQVCMRGTACRSRCSSTASPRDRYVCGVRHAEAGAAVQPLPETGMYAGYGMQKQVQLY